MAQMYVATKNFVTTSAAGARIAITKGQTLVAESDDLYRRFPQFFKVAESHYRGVEQATAAPGETRDVELPSDEPEEKTRRK